MEVIALVNCDLDHRLTMEALFICQLKPKLNTKGASLN